MSTDTPTTNDTSPAPSGDPGIGTLRTNIAARLEEKKISQRELARRAGIDNAQISRLLSGKAQTVEATTLASIATALDTSMSALYGDAAPAPAAATDAAAGDILMLRLDQLIESPLNPRKSFDEDGLAELADSIAQHGILQNLVVRPFEGNGPGKGHTTIVKTGLPLYEIVAGARRFRAAWRLKEGDYLSAASPIPCRVVAATDAEHRVLAILENLQREDVKPVEEAEAFRALVDLGWTKETIAERIGKTLRHVELRLDLVLRLAPEVQAALSEGRINLAAARALTAAPLHEQVEALRPIENGSWGWEKAADIRQKLVGAKPPLGRAIFKRDLYDGDFIPGEDGEPERFADAAQFERLQREAVAARKEKLLKKHAEVLIFDHAEGDYFHEWQYAKAEGDTGVAIVEIARDLTVKVYPNRVKPKPAAGSAARAGDAGEKAPAPEFTEAHLVKAAQIRTRALRSALAASPDGMRVAKVLVIAGLAAKGHDRHLVAVDRKNMNGADGAVLNSELPPELAERLQRALPKPGKSDWSGEQGEDRVIRALLALPSVEVDALFLAAVASAVALMPGFKCDQPGPDGPADPASVRAVATALGVDMAAAFRIDEDYVSTLKKPSLQRILRESALADQDWLSRAKLAELKAATAADAPAGYVPFELRFLAGEADAAEAGARRCRMCGCTDDRACIVDGEPCEWVEDDLCSACEELAFHAADAIAGAEEDGLFLDPEAAAWLRSDIPSRAAAIDAVTALRNGDIAGTLGFMKTHCETFDRGAAERRSDVSPATPAAAGPEPDEEDIPEILRRKA